MNRIRIRKENYFHAGEKLFPCGRKIISIREEIYSHTQGKLSPTRGMYKTMPREANEGITTIHYIIS